MLQLQGFGNTQWWYVIFKQQKLDWMRKIINPLSKRINARFEISENKIFELTHSIGTRFILGVCLSGWCGWGSAAFTVLLTFLSPTAEAFLPGLILPCFLRRIRTTNFLHWVELSWRTSWSSKHEHISKIWTLVIQDPYVSVSMSQNTLNRVTKHTQSVQGSGWGVDFIQTWDWDVWFRFISWVAME